MAATQTITIKQRLKNYTDMLRHIDNQIERLERLEATIGSPAVQHITGMPHGGGDGTSKTESQIIKKLELEEDIKEAIQQERDEYQVLAAMVAQLKKPDERLVIEMRYFDMQDWPIICETLFGRLPDYEEKLANYRRRTFLVHGTALLSLM